MTSKQLRSFLEQAYARYNHRRFVHPDPLEFMYKYDMPRDREVVGLVASSLAYGRVGQILKDVEKVLDILGPHPSQTLEVLSKRDLLFALKDFKHRFTTGSEVAGMLHAIGRLLHSDGTLLALFPDSDTVPWIEKLEVFAVTINKEAGGLQTLLPLPSKGSACKRLMLFMRWMVRKDEVDIGDWHVLGPQNLIVPLDTHMFSVARDLKLTTRRSTGLRTAMEITQRFGEIEPQDPVKYDFALTRPGIRQEN